MVPRQLSPNELPGGAASNTTTRIKSASAFTSAFVELM
jgi:hypothetical protein